MFQTDLVQSEAIYQYLGILEGEHHGWECCLFSEAHTKFNSMLWLERVGV